MQLPETVDVLIWLPGATEPVLAGEVRREWRCLSFTYDRAYLTQGKPISICARDLKTKFQGHYPQEPHVLAPALRDSLPDRWGRRALAAILSDAEGSPTFEDEIDEMQVMLLTGPDRIGALEFRAPGGQLPGAPSSASLEELGALADYIEEGQQIPPSLAHLVPACASVGGARPKALFTDEARQRKMIAKFSASGDTYPVVCGEFVAMRLAKLAGIDAAAVEIRQMGEGMGKRDVLLVERFDRVRQASGKWTRRLVASALSWTQESELSAHHISYEQLAGHIEDSFERGREAQREMFTRLVFNVLVGNTDDHARNHAAFWTGDTRELTPAYDIAPQRRASREANQAMTLANGSRAAQLQNVAAIAPSFGVTAAQFRQIVDQLVGTIVDHWSVVCDEAGLSRAEQAGFAGRQFLNEYAFDGFGPVPRLRARG